VAEGALFTVVAASRLLTSGEGISPMSVSARVGVELSPLAFAEAVNGSNANPARGAPVCRQPSPVNDGHQTTGERAEERPPRNRLRRARGRPVPHTLLKALPHNEIHRSNAAPRPLSVEARQDLNNLAASRVRTGQSE
jgi:hypothetical protein